MGLFHLITCDVLPEVYQYLITQVFLLESIMFIWKTGAYLYFESTHYSLCTFKWLVIA